MHRAFTYAEVARDALPYAAEYEAFAEEGGWSVRVQEERLSLSGTTLRFAVVDHRGVDFAIPLHVTVTPRERLGLTLAMALACVQAAAVLGETVSHVSEAEYVAAEAEGGREPDRGRSFRAVLLDCRAAAAAAFGEGYAEFLALGAGPGLAAFVGDGTAPGGP